MVPSPTPYGHLFPKMRGSQPPPKNQIAIVSGMVEATDFKFGRYILAPSEQKPIKKLGEDGAWAYSMDCPISLGTPNLKFILKATNFKLGLNIRKVHLNQAH